MTDQKKPSRETLPTSVRLSPTAMRLWQQLAKEMHLSKTGVLESAIRELARREGVKDTEVDTGL